MIVGTGVDIVAVDRFASWLLFSEQRLGRLFHPFEIQELSEKKADKAAYLASRFAVKEAFFKALTAAIDRYDLFGLPPFLTLARSIYVAKTVNGAPRLICEALFLKKIVEHGLVVHLSLSHEKGNAIAFVIIEADGSFFKSPIDFSQK